MNCSHAQQLIIAGISDEEFRTHLRDCKECSGLLEFVDSSMQLLDEPVEVPPALYQKIMGQTEFPFEEKGKQKDISLFFQFSTVLAAAVLLGIVLGFHANTQVLFSRNQKKNEALIEFKESHHLNVDRQRLF
jgi:hypothetical protein